MIWILMSIACGYACVLLLAAAWVHRRRAALRSLPFQRLVILPPANENATPRVAVAVEELESSA